MKKGREQTHFSEKSPKLAGMNEMEGEKKRGERELKKSDSDGWER